MKRASYRKAIEWIADIDSAGDSDRLDPKVCSELVTAQLVADIFGVLDSKVGDDIVRWRKKHHEAKSQ